MSKDTRISTIDLLGRLAALPESPWGNLNALQLAAQLRRFGIKPKQLWIGGSNVRGYAMEDFEDAFARYTTESEPQFEIIPGVGSPADTASPREGETARPEGQDRRALQADSARPP